MAPKTLRIVSWVKAARKDFGDFPDGAQNKAFEALSVIADGSMPDVAKPLTGLWQRRLETGDQGARRCLSPRLRAAIGRGYMGGSCLPEEIDQRDCNAETRNRSGS